MTDWFVDELFSSIQDVGGISVVYNVSRLVVDPERFENDTEEIMSSKGMGVIYTKTSDGEKLRSNVPPEQERKNLKSYLTNGGFLLASAGCSSMEWDRSFRSEIKKVFPDMSLTKITMDHPLFRTVYDISSIRLKNGGTTLLQGLEINGKIVLIYSSEGLNDTGSVKGCCCCGGNEVRNSREVNVNIFAYAVMH